jgi:hypothetical protein
MNKLLVLAVSASLVALPGCTHYTLTPDRPASLPRSSDKPVALKVGVSVEQSSDRSIGTRFVEALTQANVFSQVVTGSGPDVDLTISGRFGSEFRQDPLQTPKILLCAFTGFVTGAIMSETSYHDASGELSIRDANGAAVKSYAEKISVEATSMVSMFAESSTMKYGPPAAMDNLVAKLVQDVISDRAFYEKLRRAPPPRQADAEGTETAPAGGAAAPWWK